MASHTRDGQLALTLQEGSVGRDELLRLTNTIPISKYSVFRSLATPSRLLLKKYKDKNVPNRLCYRIRFVAFKPLVLQLSLQDMGHGQGDWRAWSFEQWETG